MLLSLAGKLFLAQNVYYMQHCEVVFAGLSLLEIFKALATWKYGKLLSYIHKCTFAILMHALAMRATV